MGTAPIRHSALDRAARLAQNRAEYL